MDRRTELRCLAGTRERRNLAAPLVEIRGESGSGVRVEGYASVFDAPYTLYEGSSLEFEETVDKRAFDKTLASNPDVPLLLNHDGMPLARTKSGTLSLGVDGHGLQISAELDSRDPEAKSVLVKMERGDVDEMSFAFYTIRDTWSADDTKRSLNEVSIHKGDVSIVRYGANPATSVGIARAIEALAEMPEEKQAEVIATLKERGALEAVKAARAALVAPAEGAPRTMSLADALAIVDGYDR